MKNNADLRRKEEFFKVGERVYLCLQPYRQTSIPKCQNLKLATQLYETFEVEARKDEVAYKLKLLAGAQIHTIFHIP